MNSGIDLAGVGTGSCKTASSRIFPNWLKAYTDYASFSEAPQYFHFWAGVSAIAGALRRKVWIDMGYFRWYPNFYILFVAPPGIATKSTTTGLALSILRDVKGIKFGPDVVTWPALVEAFAESTETFPFEGQFHTMSPLTLESSELGNLLDPSDRAMIDLLVHLWDGKQGKFDKRTKGSGKDVVENPWINLIGCTTPAWIAGNFPEYVIEGGFTSRCIFVYAEKKAKLEAYPKLCGKFPDQSIRTGLVADLCRIAQLTGEFTLTPEAVEWGTEWYKKLYGEVPPHLLDERFGGYIARKQTHIHKLAMILSASQSSNLVITKEHLSVANSLVTGLESDVQKIFNRIGKSSASLQVDRLLSYVKARKRISYSELYSHTHGQFPFVKDFEEAISGCAKAGKIKLFKGEKCATWIEYIFKKEGGERGIEA